MIRKIFIRVLQILPTILMISLILFFLSKNTPSDPVEKMIGVSNFSDQNISPKLYEQKYNQLSKNMGLDKPLFYLAIVPAGYPDKIWDMNQSDRKFYRRMIHRFPDEELVDQYFARIDELTKSMEPLVNELSSIQKIKAHQYLRRLKNADQIKASLSELSQILSDRPARIIDQLETNVRQLSNVGRKFDFMPRLKWFGWDNQYHHWITSVFKFDFGLSIRDGRPVKNKITEAISWTFLLNGAAFLLSFIISILLGTYLGGMASPFWDKAISTCTYVVYAIPVFWLATLAIVFLTTPEYGRWTNIFPGVGVVQPYSGIEFGPRFMASLPRLILPLCILCISMIAYLTRHMRSSIKMELSRPYIQLLKIKGIPRQTRLWRHALPNALFPIITLFGVLIPFIFAGSLVIEYIFNIPGMGRLLMDSILYEDWNVVFIIVFMIALATMLGLLIADLLYAWIDPRINL